MQLNLFFYYYNISRPHYVYQDFKCQDKCQVLSLQYHPDTDISFDRSSSEVSRRMSMPECFNQLLKTFQMSSSLLCLPPPHAQAVVFLIHVPHAPSLFDPSDDIHFLLKATRRVLPVRKHAAYVRGLKCKWYLTEMSAGPLWTQT